MMSGLSDLLRLLPILNMIWLLVIGYRLVTQDGASRELANRLTRLEARVESMPTHRDLRDLQESINSIQEDVASLAGKTDTQTQLLRMIQEHLLERDRR